MNESTCTTYAETAAEAIRSLNHATLAPDGHTVVDVYHVTADLANMAFRMRQACDQLAGILGDRLEHGRLSADDLTRPADAIGEAQSELRLAMIAADDLGRALYATQNAIAIVGEAV